MAARLVFVFALFSSCSAVPLESKPCDTAATLTLLPHSSIPREAYQRLSAALSPLVCSASPSASSSLCVAHTTDGAILEEIATPSRCSLGVVLLGAAPSLAQLQRVQVPVLVLHGSLDGVTRFSSFAVSRHLALKTQLPHPVRFASLPGASHHSFVDSAAAASSAVHGLDLEAAMSHEDAVSAVAPIVSDFLASTWGEGEKKEQGALEGAEASAAKLSKAVVAALEMEGSTQLGHPACNSDFPTNPSCQYPKWPDHSLPFGPSPAPSPPLPSDCICGSPWVKEHAGRIIAAFELSGNPSATVTSNDAFHDVSDTHPFHLPHIFNTCEKNDTSCVLNTTTLTMPLAKGSSDPLFPNASSAPLSVFELRTKLKSREALWDAVGLKASSSVDKNMTMCKAINDLAYTWAINNADDSVRDRFLKDGEPFVMVDDKKATIGITGPEWIKDELVYTRVQGANGKSHIEVQSWEFTVGNTNEGHVPWFYPVGMHYCKLLSPARVMEWIYTDGLRAQRSLRSK